MSVSILLKPPEDQPYDTLKAQLIKRTTASEQCKLQQLINGEELGDRKPTQLLRRMQHLLDHKLATADANSFLRELFLQRLPANVRMVLASTDSSMDLNKLADKVIEVYSYAYQSPLVPDAWHQKDLRSPEKSLSTCCSWELSVPVPGLPPCT